jgi:hypothetical protein
MAGTNFPNFGDRTIDRFRSQLKGGGARPNLFEVEAAFPTGLGVSDQERFRFLIKAASLPASTMGVIDVPFRGRNLKIAGDRTFEPWTITVINDTDFFIRNAFERWMNWMNKLDDNAGVITPNSYQGDWIVNQLGRGTQVTTSVAGTGAGLPAGKMPVLKQYVMKGCFPTSISAIDLSYDSSDTIEEFTVDLQVQWFDILNPTNSNGGDSPASSDSGSATMTNNLVSINAAESTTSNTSTTV